MPHRFAAGAAWDPFWADTPQNRDPASCTWSKAMKLLVLKPVSKQWQFLFTEVENLMVGLVWRGGEKRKQN